MKKLLIYILAMCLCVSLCACGRNAESVETTVIQQTEEVTEEAKSVEAQKADELILAIGEVSMESESAILAAKAYYDTLTNEQILQVENVDILESAIEDFDTLKKEDEYKAIYNQAVKYEKNQQIDEAYAEYEKLPSDYKNAAERMNEIAPLVGVAGKWHCDSFSAISNKGTELGIMFKSIDLTVESISNGQIELSYVGEWADSQYTNSSIIAGHADLLFLLEDGGAWGTLRQTKEGNWFLGDSSAGSTGVGTITTAYYITTEGNLIVEYSRDNDGDITTVAFTYSKQ